MPILGSKRSKLIILGLSVIAILVIVKWPSRPEKIIAMIAVQERKGEEGEKNGQRTRDKLIACGPSAIMPTIDAIREHSAWVRGYAYLPQVLGGLGEPAHKSLLAAIDSEHDDGARAHLISALQVAFNDFSRFDRWLTNAGSGSSSSYEINHFSANIRYSFPNAPELGGNSGVNTEFLKWWATNESARTRGDQ
jgi:hypothetical protein